MIRHILPIIAMGFFSLFFGCNKQSGPSAKASGASPPSVFVSEAAFKKNRAKQIAMAPQTLKQLRDLGVKVDSKLKLEYFFYSDNRAEAESLAKELADRGYTGEVDSDASDTSQFVITGWTVPIQMSDEIVVGWTGEMCDLGYKFDCEFDGWGTNPDQ